MTKRVTVTWVLAISLGFLAAAPARAEIGSVISSFPAGRYYGIYRQGNYVYLSQNENNNNYLRTYTLTGAYLRRVRLLGAAPYPLYSGSRTHLGAGYVALCDNDAGYLKIFSIAAGGSPVASFRAGTPYNCFWNGEYYYVNGRSDRGFFRRFTRNGGPAGNWTCSGWSPYPYCGGAEYARRGNNGEGPYFVASPDSSVRPLGMTTFPGGSLVKTWIEPSGQVTHLAYGDSSNPGVYGAAIWAILYNPYRVIEIDIDARGASAVMPASLGKVKAIYR